MVQLSIMDRKKNEREEHPSLLAIDSQSIKLAPFISEARGIDGNKKINGRKRHICLRLTG